MSEDKDMDEKVEEMTDKLEELENEGDFKEMIGELGNFASNMTD